MKKSNISARGELWAWKNAGVIRNARGGYSIIGVIVFALIVVLLGYLLVNKLINLAIESGEKENASGGGAVIKAFVNDDVEGMQAAIAKNANDKFLYESVAKNSPDDAASALASGGNVQMRNSAGATLLHRAVANESVEIAKMLIEHGAKVDAQTKRGMTPLHSALIAPRPNKDIVVLLLEEWADMDLQDNNGDTALHLAARKGEVEIASLLIEYGAKLNIKNKEKRRPLAIASEACQEKIVQLLQESGAER